MDTDKLSAYQTLYVCLTTVAKLLAPFAPFYADRLWGDLSNSTCSVHLTRFPEADDTVIDSELEVRMELAQKITSMTLALRRKVNIKVRQPLQQIMIPAVDATQKMHIEAVKELIKNEVNVKELRFVEGSSVLVKKVKCNFRTMGKKYGSLMKDIAAQMSALTQLRIADLERDGKIELNIAGQFVSVDITDVEIINEDIPGWLVANESNLTVALEVELTEALRREGMARELINRIQNLRKESGLEITDRIRVTLSPYPQVETAVADYGKYICTQVLADTIELADNAGAEIDFDEFTIRIVVEKI